MDAKNLLISIIDELNDCNTDDLDGYLDYFADHFNDQLEELDLPTFKRVYEE